MTIAHIRRKRGRLACLIRDEVIAVRGFFGKIKDGAGQSRVKNCGGFNREVYRFFDAEPDLILQHGWFRPRYFASESWRGDLTSDDSGPVPVFYAGDKCFLWKAEAGQVEFELSDPEWKWRQIVIAFRAYDYFNPEKD